MEKRVTMLDRLQAYEGKAIHLNEHGGFSVAFTGKENLITLDAFDNPGTS